MKMTEKTVRYRLTTTKIAVSENALETNMSLKNVGYASLCYCATCFVIAAGSYLVIWATGNLEFRNPATGAIWEDFTISGSSAFQIALLMGAMTTLFCLGGLLGVWILAARARGTLRLHLVGGTLLALLGCGIFLFGASLGEEHLFLRAFEVAAVSIVAAVLARLYVAATPRLTTSS